MCANLIISVAMVTLLTGSCTALVGTLVGKDLVEAGSQLVLNCTLDSMANGGRTAEDVIWRRYPRQLPLYAYSAVNETLSQLSLSNVTFNDSGRYTCSFLGDSFFQKHQVVVHVGSKPEPAMLDCSVPSPDEFFCHWEAGSNTNIVTLHEFTFWYDGTWMDCPQYQAFNTCTVQRIRDANQYVRVTSTNDLGTSSVNKTFNMYKDVVVNQPRNVKVVKVETETSLRVTWEQPARWFPSRRSLFYKIRFRMNDCVMNSSHCCCWTEVMYPETRASEHLMQTLRNLEPYTIYVVQVAAWYPLSSDENWSDWSKEVVKRTREMAPTEIVQNLYMQTEPYVANPNYKRNILVFWMGLQRGQVLGYKVLVLAESSLEIYQENVTDQNWLQILDLERFRGYHIKVAAYNKMGIGPWSEMHVEDETTAPNTPDEVMAVALTMTSILVEWVEPSEPNSNIKCYIVQWELHNRDRQSYITPNATVLSHVLDGLKPNSLYEVGVKTRNIHGDSEIKFVKGGVWTGVQGDEEQQQNATLISVPSEEVLAARSINNLQQASIVLLVVALVIALIAVCVWSWKRIRHAKSVKDTDASDVSVEQKYNQMALKRC